MLHAPRLRLIEPQLRGFDGHVRRELPRRDLVEEPQVVVADRVGLTELREGFAELGVDEPAAVLDDRRPRVEGVLRALPRHELASGALHDLALESEVVEGLVLRGGEDERTADGHERVG